jgi:hypothetical protein
MQTLIPAVLVVSALSGILVVADWVLELERKRAAISEADYKRGYEEGKKSVEDHLPKHCVAWWFDHEDMTKRNAQIRKAFCTKGSDGRKKVN